ncbi:MAG: phosphonopyruvate decarboxylase [Lachnospiraceae bacterium]|nr:phosphonopyruvate decarboxylase [Lachnospiraceae bacterium]
MRAGEFIDILAADFYAGVPDSLLKPFCDCLYGRYGTDPSRHVIAANEGNAAALAAGYYLATGKPAAVYMQNSGEGNIINPLASLLNEKVYGIPVVFIIGWRGEPGVKDEPQHIYQGEVTLKLMEDMGVRSFVIDADTEPEEFKKLHEKNREALEQGHCVAYVIRKGALLPEGAAEYTDIAALRREKVIEKIARAAYGDVIVSTTGKISRELFEVRERNGETHAGDFLCVGSMGHASSIALGIAIQKPERRIWCIDGDGAFLMHMGAAAVIGAAAPANLIHIVLNNGAHETVGGMPTAAGTADLPGIALSCGYRRVLRAENEKEADEVLEYLREAGELSFCEIRCALGSRSDLGRPTTTAMENRDMFMEGLGTDDPNGCPIA